MENEGQLNSNVEQDLELTLGDYTAWNSPEEYELDALLDGADDHQSSEDEYSPPPAKRPKRFSVQQVQELEAKFRVCTHPETEARQELGAKIGLQECQVRYWFQNRRSSMKLKAYGNENKDMQQENANLRHEKMVLQKRVLELLCFRCRYPTRAKQLTPEQLRLSRENARLRNELKRARAHLNSLLEAQRCPHSMSSEHLPLANMDPVPFSYDCRTDKATLLSHAERALKEFIMFATEGEPMWMPTIDGEMFIDEHYDMQTFPGILGLCPLGFAVEATRETDVVKGAAMDIVTILVDPAQWSVMFPGIVAHVRTCDVISSGSSSSCDGLIQMMDVEFWVQSPRVPTRSVKFMRFIKMLPNGQWAVVDVSVDGNHGIEKELCTNGCTAGYRLLPSGCLLEDMTGGFCKVTWAVHGEYLEATVPVLFRQFFHSGQAFGARRWLESLQRQYEYMTILNDPISSSSSRAAISPLGRKGVMELAHRMTMSFYAAVSGSLTIASTNIVDQWCSSSGGGAGGETLEAAVRMMSWNCTEITPGDPNITVLSAAATVWLPGTPPPRVFEYLCNLRRRGEWDAAIKGEQVQEVASVATCTYRHGDTVSILHPTVVADATNSNMLILQQTSSDASGSLVVYCLVEENLMRGIMAGGGKTGIFLLPSGFAVLPDGHGNGAGSLLTVASQLMLPGSPSGDLASGTFDNAGQRICQAILKIKDAVGASNVIPA